MMPAILDFMRRTKSELSIRTGRLVEVGSLDVNGSPRSIFTDADPYVGIDLEMGPGVDVVCDGERITDYVPIRSADTVVCCETLEHTVRPWLVVDAMKAVLRPGGHLWISTPTFGFPLHRYPLDCYRFGEDAYRQWLFADMELLRLEHVQADENHPAIVAIGRKR